MNSFWRFFMVVEALLLSFVVWQIVNNTGLLLLVIFDIFNIYLTMRKYPRTRFQNFQLILGSLVIFFSLVSSPTLWTMVVLTVLSIRLKGVEIPGIGLTKSAFWRKKQIMIVQTEQLKTRDNERRRQQLFGNQRVRNDVYEWDNINIVITSGGTIIGLSNTLLPKDNSIVIVRRGIGKTRILIPLGMTIRLGHVILVGNVLFKEEQFSLKNEQIKICSSDYNENPCRLKTITDTLVGDVEMIRV